MGARISQRPFGGCAPSSGETKKATSEKTTMNKRFRSMAISSARAN
jgi:hypothetical protein